MESEGLVMVITKIKSLRTVMSLMMTIVAFELNFEGTRKVQKVITMLPLPSLIVRKDNELVVLAMFTRL